MKLTKIDIEELKRRGITEEEIHRQIENFKNKFPFIKLKRPATVGNGIISFDEERINKFIEIFENNNNLKKIKFVPASGAATRMFKALHEFDDTFKQSGNDINILKKDAYKSIRFFFDNIKKLAFFDDLDKKVNEITGENVESLLSQNRHNEIIEILLNSDGLNYSNLPKGLLKFHKYSDHSRTAFEEQISESIFYCKNYDNVVPNHFTVSTEFTNKFISLSEELKRKYEPAYNVNLDITFSVQNPSTDTIAVDSNFELVRNTDGSLYFHPAGHGALLENLNNINGDLIFIKNIDNVVPFEKQNLIAKYKKFLGGLLIYYKNKVDSYLKKIESEYSTELETEILDFIKKELFIEIPADKKIKDLKTFLFEKLNRPIRVCGMVKNMGEPGGGPFWVENHDGTSSLQIVESSQINHHDRVQDLILQSSTHFNPVDIVCNIYDYKGNKFDLKKFRDLSQGIITTKTLKNKKIYVQELPGLWNGSMADWNTIFVEVPIETFNPVKTVFDLLKPTHSNIN